MQDRYIFRGKRKDGQGWIEGFYFFNGSEYGIISNELYPGSWQEVDPETVGQVFQTNLPRLPQIAIGDIVKVRGMKRVGEYITEIVHAPNGGYTLKENKTYLNNDSILVAIAEIVGNRWDNPELLN